MFKALELQKLPCSNVRIINEIFRVTCSCSASYRVLVIEQRFQEADETIAMRGPHRRTSRREENVEQAVHGVASDVTRHVVQATGQADVKPLPVVVIFLLIVSSFSQASGKNNNIFSLYFFRNEIWISWQILKETMSILLPFLFHYNLQTNLNLERFRSLIWN